jgi:putative membrane protein
MTFTTIARRAALVAALVMPAAAAASPDQPGTSAGSAGKKSPTTKPTDTTKPGNTTTRPGDTSMKPGDTSMKPGDTSMKPGDTSMKPGDSSMKPGDTGNKTTDTGNNKPGKDQKQLADTDLQALTDLHATDQAEIEMGNLAKTHASSKAVKAYGAMLVQDHQRAEKNIQTIAKAHGATLADQPMMSDPTQADQMKKDMAGMDHLKTLEGASFDQEYLSMMIDGHTRALARIDTAMGMVTDAKVKALLTKVRPIVKRHADKAKALQSPRKSAMR